MKILLAFTLCIACYLTPDAQDMATFKKFRLSSLISDRKQRNTDWLKFLDEETVYAGIYAVKAGDKDNQPAHEFDEVYYVLNGQSEFQTGGLKFDAKAGKIIYVPAGAGHHFVNIKENLELLVLFSKAAPSATNTAKEFDLKELTKAAVPNENYWNPFLKANTMAFGLYQLPKALGGDESLNHTWDEINVVTRGGAKFSVNGTTTDVAVGDIVYVKKGNGHYFHDLTSDFDVLILFERKSVK